MAEALVTVLLDQLASITRKSIEENVSLVKNVENDVKKLTSNLEAIEAVLEDAEKKQLTDRSVKRWVEKLKYASFEMDNVLDEWNTDILQFKIQKEIVVDDHQNKNKKLCFSIPSPFSCCRAKVNRLVMRHEIAHKIKDLNQTLAAIASEKDKYNFNAAITEKPLDRPTTTSFIDETEVEGRDVDKEVLVSKLLGDNSTLHDEGLHVIPIVGMGGLGKTTLAQLAYNDDTVKAHFDLRIWVCVSDPFEEIKVAKAIIEEVEGSTPNISELNSLLQRVVKCIEGKKFLLVLDDVWTKDSKKWNQFKQPLKCGSMGSSVLVTTRKEEVAKMMGATSKMITLEKLSEEHCWLVFNKMAFLERSEEECKELDEIGRQIANKCKGLPLAAKSLGSLMCFKKSKTQWEGVLCSELWRLENVKETFAPFLLSYYDLSAKEKRCFSYCSIFPKDYRIKRDNLIEMWMSQNYFRNEEEGHECFDNLVMRSFFQNFGRNELTGRIEYCKMHDIVHDFAQFVMGNECLAFQVDSVENERLKLSNVKARHLTIVVESHAEFPGLDFAEISKTSLCTLFVVNGIRSIKWSTVLPHLTCLRSLTLSHCDFEEIPANVGGLIHLRYLDLSWSGNLKELPDALCELCNLQTLNLSFCHNLQGLPEGVGKLVNLRHLYVWDLINLKGFPKGFGKLTSLRSLDLFYIAEDKEVYFDIGDLKRFRNLQLRGTFIIVNCRNLRSMDDAKKVDLKRISQYLDRLQLSFVKIRNDTIREEDSGIVEGLEPHPNLLSLKIFNYMATTFSPTWIPRLTNLRKITLHVLANVEVLPCLGTLPSLEVIRFWNMHKVKKVGLEFLGMTESSATPITLFPRLKKLEFVGMSELESWEGKIVKDVVTIMPCLVSLTFGYCPRLKEIPDFLETTTSLKELEIYDSEIMEEYCRKKSGSEWAKISHIPNIKLTYEYAQKDGIWIEERNHPAE